jgi:hypothetical protein
MDEQLEKAALDYHRFPTPGKRIAVDPRGVGWLLAASAAWTGCGVVVSERVTCNSVIPLATLPEAGFPSRRDFVPLRSHPLATLPRRGGPLTRGVSAGCSRRAQPGLDVGWSCLSASRATQTFIRPDDGERRDAAPPRRTQSHAQEEHPMDEQLEKAALDYHRFPAPGPHRAARRRRVG